MRNLGIVVTLLLLLVIAADASAIEGCKYCKKMEIYAKVYCRDLNIGGEWYASCSFSSSNDCSGQPSGCNAWTGWAPKELGDKCTTIGGTLSLSAIVVNDHQASKSMTDWLEQRLNAPAGYEYGDSFSPYTWNVEGTTSCTPSYTTQTWTTEYGGVPFSYQVKIHSCAQSGSACDQDTTVQP